MKNNTLSKKKLRRARFFNKLTGAITKKAGSPVAAIFAFVLILGWAITGPIFGFSDTWQLVINTGTTIITFLMVFVIQQTQNKDTMALQLKLNELIACDPKASNRLVDIEDLTEEELDIIKNFYRKLAVLAEKQNDLHSSHSLDEADENQIRKAKVK